MQTPSSLVVGYSFQLNNCSYPPQHLADYHSNNDDYNGDGDNYDDKSDDEDDNDDKRRKAWFSETVIFFGSDISKVREITTSWLPTKRLEIDAYMAI